MTIRECVEHYWEEPEFMLDADVKKWRIALRVADWSGSGFCGDVKAAAQWIFSETTNYDAAASAPDVKVLAKRAKGQYDAQHMHADSGRGLGAVVFVNYFPEDMLWEKIQHEAAHHAGKSEADAKKAESCATRDKEKEDEENDDDDNGGGGGGTGGSSGTWIWVPTDTEEVCESPDLGQWTCVWVSSGNPQDGGGYYHCTGCCSTDICWDKIVTPGHWVWAET